MNIIRPGDILFLTAPLSFHAQNAAEGEQLKEAFNKNLAELNAILPRLGVEMTWVALSVAEANATPEVLFVYRPSKSCVCED